MELEFVLFLFCCALFLGVYVWVSWFGIRWLGIRGLRESHYSMIEAQDQYLQALKDYQQHNDVMFIMENGRT
uniref:Uncharacterized protein n=1 Tax=viral metagenome TaxID=1070528 RepID=A0A6C0AIT4_9ZZZZ